MAGTETMPAEVLSVLVQARGAQDGTPSKTFGRCLTKDPSRVITVDGKPCFRFWVPPFVKGPADKPFVPKVRVAA